jgi:peptide/nickel transport system substrate-binding protein
MVKSRLITAALLALGVSAMPMAAMAQSPLAATAPKEIVPASLSEVPRNQTAVLGWGVALSSPIGVTNPWALPGYTHQEGNAFMWEPLMYFAIFKGEYVPWLADSMEYTDDTFTALEIKLNPGAKWSDGEQVTAADVKFTFDGQLNNSKLPYNAHFNQFVESTEIVDDLTVLVKFKAPAPRFKFEVLTEKFDTGIPIVPEHFLADKPDVNMEPGGVDMPHSGPYDLIAWNAAQKIFDYRPDWWAVAAGRIAEPAVKRVIIANITGVSMDTVAQRLVNNEFDSALDMRSSVIGNILAQNPEITTHTGNASPFGYLDWWPNSLWMNTQLEPYSDPKVRRAMSLIINRDVINDILYEGAQIATIYPFPLYPNLQAFADSPAVKALEEQYQPRLFDPDQSAALMTEAGFTMNGDGLWEKDGNTVDATIQGFENIHGDIVPILVEMLRQGGFDASINFGPDANQNMIDGKAGLYMFGHGASLYDPFEALNLFHGKYSAAIGSSAGNNRYSRYNNPEYDAILDSIAPLSSEDPKFQEGAAQALGIYWRDQIDIPIIQWLHRIAYNQHYWTNWPTEANPAMGTNGAFWAHTGMLVITSLQPSGAQ